MHSNALQSDEKLKDKENLFGKEKQMGKICSFITFDTAVRTVSRDGVLGS